MLQRTEREENMNSRATERIIYEVSSFSNDRRRSRRTNNRIIRDAMNETQTYQWQLADLLHCSPDKISRALRHELPVEQQERIAYLIRKEYGEQNG